MSILIKGMEMPKTGRYFVAVDNKDGKDKAVIAIMSEFERGNKTRPLLAVHEIVPVPPHGRLIEKNAVFQLIQSMPSVDRLLPTEFMKAIYELPTIIPAEEATKV